MIYVIRRVPKEGPEVFWMGRDLKGDWWGPRVDAASIAGADHADDEARRLSEIFDGKLYIETAA